MSLIETVKAALYHEDFWLPGNVTWKDLESTPDHRYPQGSDLLIPLAIAPLLLLLRMVFEKVVGTRVALYLGIPAPAPPLHVPCLHPELERAFRINRKPSSTEISALAKRIDVSQVKMLKWFRLKNRSVRPNLLTKFNESFWKFCYYLCAFAYGCWVVADEPWAFDTRQFWVGFPHHKLNGDVYAYYIGVLGFYWSLILSHFFDVQRKDFWQMFLHHLVTISLMSFSWFNNMVRVGCYIIVLHDAVDYWLEGAKMAKYCRFDRLCDVLFVIFTLVWLGTRLVVYPLYPLYSVAFECRQILAPFHAWYIFLTLLCVLQLLHFIWFYMILRVAYNALTAGEVEKDSRSDSEGESTVDEQLTLDSTDDDDNGESSAHDTSAPSKFTATTKMTTEVNSNIVKTNGNLYQSPLSGNGDCCLSHES